MLTTKYHPSERETQGSGMSPRDCAALFGRCV
eukprot:COSAG02_NODE_64554_length_260_cov_0.645963_1_plen_31_part_01